MQSDSRVEFDVAKYAFKTDVKTQQVFIYLQILPLFFGVVDPNSSFSAGLPIGLN